MNEDFSKIEKEVLEDGYEWVDNNKGKIIEFLIEITERESITGDEGTCDDPDSAVGYLWNFLNDNIEDDKIELSKQRIPDRSDYVDKKRDNIYTVFHGRGDKGFICESHTDVVPPGDLSKWPDEDPFTVKNAVVRRIDDCKVEIEYDGKTVQREIREEMDKIWKKRDYKETESLIGRGVFDNKSSIACLVGSLLALSAGLKDKDAKLAGDLIHAHLVDEEKRAIGIRNMVGWPGHQDWLGDRYDSYDGFSAVVLEGSYGFVPILGFRGVFWGRIRAKGSSCHVSTPSLGRNAVLGMSKALAQLDTEESFDKIAELFIEDELLGELTIAPGTTVVGGEVYNVDKETGEIERGGYNTISDWCEATFDMRAPRWERFPEVIDDTIEKIEGVIKNEAKKAAPEIDFEVEIFQENFRPPVALVKSQKVALDNPLVRSASKTAEDIFGYMPGTGIAPGGTDASILYHGTHIPTLAEYGPGGGLSHESLEYVEVDQVIEGAKAMLNLAVREIGIKES